MVDRLSLVDVPPSSSLLFCSFNIFSCSCNFSALQRKPSCSSGFLQFTVKNHVVWASHMHPISFYFVLNFMCFPELYRHETSLPNIYWQWHLKTIVLLSRALPLIDFSSLVLSNACNNRSEPGVSLVELQLVCLLAQ